MPLTYEIVGFPDVIVPHSDFQGLLCQVTVLYLIEKLLWRSRGRARMNQGLGLPILLLLRLCCPQGTQPNPSHSDQGGDFLSFKSEVEKSPLVRTTPTSLNSGFSVFFFTAVLCLDFLSSSGFK